MQHASNNNHSRAKQRRDRVELGSQDGRNFHYEDGAHHATANSCKHAEQYRCNRAGVKGQRLTRTSNRKERESGGIEYQHRAAQPVDNSISIECSQTREDRHRHLSPLAHCCRRNRSNHQVARDPARIASGKR